jgi:hypothetical protein
MNALLAVSAHAKRLRVRMCGVTDVRPNPGMTTEPTKATAITLLAQKSTVDMRQKTGTMTKSTRAPAIALLPKETERKQEIARPLKDTGRESGMQRMIFTSTVARSGRESGMQRKIFTSTVARSEKTAAETTASGRLFPEEAKENKNLKATSREESLLRMYLRQTTQRDTSPCTSTRSKRFQTPLQ